MQILHNSFENWKFVVNFQFENGVREACKRENRNPATLRYGKDSKRKKRKNEKIKY